MGGFCKEEEMKYAWFLVRDRFRVAIQGEEIFQRNLLFFGKNKSKTVFVSLKPSVEVN